MLFFHPWQNTSNWHPTFSNRCYKGTPHAGPTGDGKPQARRGPQPRFELQNHNPSAILTPARPGIGGNWPQGTGRRSSKPRQYQDFGEPRAGRRAPERFADKSSALVAYGCSKRQSYRFRNISQPPNPRKSVKPLKKVKI